VVTAGAGYWSKAGVDNVDAMGFCTLVAQASGKRTERTPCGAVGPPPKPLTGSHWMRWKMNQEPNRAIYRRRKCAVETVFGQVKEARGFRQFSFRGLQAVAEEWDLICMVHNALKLFKASRSAFGAC
jgi:hypothetical protein